MISGIGCDIVSVGRIQMLMDDYGQRFLNKIFTITEVRDGMSRASDARAAFFAKRFAAKEAVSKSFGTGIGEHIDFKDIEVLNDDKGKPLIKLHKHYEGVVAHVSLSDDGEYAIAYAILEKI